MTPEALTALALCLIDLRDWLNDQDPGCFDAGYVDHMIDLCASIRRRLVADGAR